MAEAPMHTVNQPSSTGLIAISVFLLFSVLFLTHGIYSNMMYMLDCYMEYNIQSPRCIVDMKNHEFFPGHMIFSLVFGSLIFIPMALFFMYLLRNVTGRLNEMTPIIEFYPDKMIHHDIYAAKRKTVIISELAEIKLDKTRFKFRYKNKKPFRLIMFFFVNKSELDEIPNILNSYKQQNSNLSIVIE